MSDANPFAEFAVVAQSPAQAVVERTRRRPSVFVTVLLWLISPAWCELYAGQVRRALLYVVLATLLLPAVFLVLLLPWPPTNIVLAVVVLLGVRVAFLVEALLAIRRDPLKAARDRPRWYWFVVWLVVESLWMTGVVEFWKSQVAQAYRVTSRNMDPTLLRGDRIVAWKWGANARVWQRLDVVTYHPPVNPEGLYIGRIIGLPGETVEVRDNQVLIDGEPLSEPHAAWIVSDSRHELDPHGPERVPDDTVFILGDNRHRSQDSRHFGPVSRSALQGSVEVIYFSQNYEEQPEMPLGRPPVRKSGPIRWNRFGLHVH